MAATRFRSVTFLPTPADAFLNSTPLLSKQGNTFIFGGGNFTINPRLCWCASSNATKRELRIRPD